MGLRTLVHQIDLGWLREFVGGDPKGPAFAEEEAAFQQEEGVRTWRLLIAVILLSTIAWGGTDESLYPEDPVAPSLLVECRVFLILASLFVLFVAPRWRPFAARPVATMTLTCVAMFMVVAYAYSELDTNVDRWFLYLCPLPLATLAGAYRPLRRAGVNLLFCAGLLAGYFVRHLDMLREPYMPRQISFLFEMAGLSTLGGAAINSVRRRAFVLRRKADAQAAEVRRLNAELEGWNESLERRVREQTAELRLLTSHIESARETERTRIARDLHDELGQELTALKMAVSVARSRFERDPACISANLETVASLVDNTTVITRQLVKDLRPRVLDDLGLTAAAEWLVKSAEQRGGGHYTLSLPSGELRPPEAVAVATFRGIQEALTNVARHAQATEAHVELRAEEGNRLFVTIRDNGVGMATPGLPTAGMGLIGMRERVRALSGELTITSQPGQGTCVEAWLPLSPGPVEARA